MFERTNMRPNQCYCAYTEIVSTWLFIIIILLCNIDVCQYWQWLALLRTHGSVFIVENRQIGFQVVRATLQPLTTYTSVGIQPQGWGCSSVWQRPHVQICTIHEGSLICMHDVVAHTEDLRHLKSWSEGTMWSVKVITTLVPTGIRTPNRLVQRQTHYHWAKLTDLLFY